MKQILLKAKRHLDKFLGVKGFERLMTDKLFNPKLEYWLKWG